MPLMKSWDVDAGAERAPTILPSMRARDDGKEASSLHFTSIVAATRRHRHAMRDIERGARVIYFRLPSPRQLLMPLRRRRYLYSLPHCRLTRAYQHTAVDDYRAAAYYY